MLRTRTLVAMASVIFLATASTALADSIVKNGGFELLNPSIPNQPKPANWWSSGGTQSDPAGGYGGSGETISPLADSRMAVMATGGTMSQDLLQQVDFTGYSWVTLSFWFRYQARDQDIADNGLDRLELYAKEDGGTAPNPLDATWDLVWWIPINVDPVDGWVITPWQQVTASGPTDGTGLITFRFYLRNGQLGGVLDGGELSTGNPPSGQQTIAFLDEVSITGIPTIPEPSTMVLVGVGLAGLARARRRPRSRAARP